MLCENKLLSHFQHVDEGANQNCVVHWYGYTLTDRTYEPSENVLIIQLRSVGALNRGLEQCEKDINENMGTVENKRGTQNNKQ